MKDFSMYKYFKGELKNPFSENDLLASKWWNGERLFYENAQSNPHFIDIIRKQLKEAIETNNVSSILVDETVDINRRILISIWIYGIPNGFPMIILMRYSNIKNRPSNFNLIDF